MGAFFLLLAALALVLWTSNALAASRIYGTVTDADTDDPIEEANVYIYDPDNKDNSHKTTTDGEGYYEVTVDPGHYEIQISKDGYETHKGEEDVGFEEQVEHNAELIPKEETYLEGYITDANTGEPIEGATVTLSSQEDDKGDDKKGKSGAELEARKSGSDDKEGKSGADDKEEKDGGKLTGTTNSEGYYNISCDDGKYKINITHDDYENHNDQISIETGVNRYDAALTRSADDEGGNDNGGDDDDGGFELVGSGGLMISGWIVAAVLIVFIVSLLRDREEEYEEEDE